MASIELSFIDYPKAKINSKEELLVRIRDDSGSLKIDKKLKKGEIELKTPFFREWNIEAYNKSQKVFQHKLKLEKQVVFINFKDIALGDTIMWPSYLEKFRQKHKCKLYVKMHHAELFEKSYPNIIFLKKGQSVKNVDVQITPRVLVDGAPLLDGPPSILGLEKRELRPLIDKPALKRNIEKKYVCIATHSSSYYKYWLRKNGWNDVINYLKELGYEVLCIDGDDIADYGLVKMHVPNGCIKRTGMRPLSERVNDLYFCDFFVGLGSGLSWLAWAMEKPVVMIAGFSSEDCEFKTPYRVINKNVCHGCWGKKEGANDPFYCPEHYGTSRQHECSREITFEMVKEKISKLVLSSSHDPQQAADQ